MFPFQQINEFSQQISCNPHQDIVQNDQFSGGASNNLTKLMGDGQPQPPAILANSKTKNDVGFSCDDKKIIRKEIERQRRQQMSTLCASLRSLLPLESLKVNNNNGPSLFLSLSLLSKFTRAA